MQNVCNLIQIISLSEAQFYKIIFEPIVTEHKGMHNKILANVLSGFKRK